MSEAWLGLCLSSERLHHIPSCLRTYNQLSASAVPIGPGIYRNPGLIIRSLGTKWLTPPFSTIFRVPWSPPKTERR